MHLCAAYNNEAEHLKIISRIIVKMVLIALPLNRQIGVTS